ncbi:MarR family transcriptional regulator [Fischerella sp. PCC 9605]|uniref:MarR family transcriptional regulator n=1 Tax=Fischerella sp. PCC 9605 TaxID=1173024 RepID=UPI0004ACB023|nr:MarR family transcriptional regulator [Fischerella sp. PCC 9605]
MSSSQSKRAELIDALSQAGRKLSTRTVMFHSAIAQRVGLSTTDHKALDILIRTGPITAGQLAELTGLTTGAITGVIDRLEKVGFVRREKVSNDRRRVLIQPLEERADLAIAPLFDSFSQAMAELYSRYSDQELAVVLDFMIRSTTILQEETAKLQEEATAARKPEQAEVTERESHS